MGDEEAKPIFSFAEVLAQQQQQQQQQQHEEARVKSSSSRTANNIVTGTDQGIDHVDDGVGAEDKQSRSKKKGFRRRFQDTFHRGLSLAATATTISLTASRDYNNDDASDDNDEAASVATAVSIPRDVAAKAVPLTEERLSQVVSKSRFIQRYQRLNDIPCYTREAFQQKRQQQTQEGEQSSTTTSTSTSNLELIGFGGFSNVHKLEASQWRISSELTEDEHEGKTYAIKSVKAECARSPERLAMAAADLMVEAHMLSAVHHPHIITLRGISSYKKGLIGLKEGRVDELFLILDYLPSTLYGRLIEWQDHADEVEQLRGQPVSVSTGAEVSTESTLIERLNVAVGLASALDYLHSKGVIYRDVKPSNVGFNAQGCLKLFDFGLAVSVPSSSRYPNKVFDLEGKKGTARYMAYEVAKERPYNGKADVFSLAILLWELVALEKPFGDLQCSDRILQRIMRGDRPPLQSLWLPSTNNPQSLQHPAKSKAKLEQLIQNSWSKNSAERPSMKEMHQQLVRILKAEGVSSTCPVLQV